MKSEGTTAYDVVQRLRPNWLLQRGPTSIRQSSGAVMIYVDGVRYGDVSTLRGIPASTIIGMRYFNAADATFKFSVTNGGGVIEVYTRLQ